LALAEEAEPHLTGAQQGEWLDRLETELDNLRTALDWSLAAASHKAEGRNQKAEGGGQPTAGTPDGSQLPTAYCLPPTAEMGLRLAAALGSFWRLRRYLTEGRQWLAQALAGEWGTPADRAKALFAAGVLASRQADYSAARSLQEESLALR